MKATKHTHHHSKLIADIVVPRRVTNRRGHAMAEETLPEHQCYEHEQPVHYLRPQKPMSLAKFSLLPGVIYSLKTMLPAWAPRRFTLEHGVQTNWQAVLPPRQTLANTGVLAGFLVMAVLAVWALPQKSASQVIAEQPTRTSNNSKPQSTPSQGVLAATSTPTTPEQPTVWRLPVVYRSSSSVIPALVAQPQPSASAAPTSSSLASQDSTPPPTETTTTTTPTPTTGGETTTPPTETTTTPTNPPTDPPTQPVDPPVVIVDPPLDGLQQLLD